MRWNLIGLGYLGLNQLADAEQAFAMALKHEAMHFGAKTHQQATAKRKEAKLPL